MQAIRNVSTDIIHLAFNGDDVTICRLMPDIAKRVQAGTCLDISLGRHVRHLLPITTCGRCIATARRQRK